MDSKTVHKYEIRGDIVEQTAVDFLAFLQAANGDDIEVYLASDGGEVLPGFSMANAVASYLGHSTVVIERALSIAGYIAIHFEHLVATNNCLMMLHRAHIDGKIPDPVMAGVLDRMSSSMERALAARLNIKQSEAAQLMRREQFFDGPEAFRVGLVDELRAPDVVPGARRHNQKLELALASGNPLSIWKQRLAIEQARGKSHEDAIASVDKSFPGLRMQAVASANKKQAVAPKQFSNALATWKSELARARGTGLSHERAIKHVVTANPGLREEMIEEVNANRGRGPTK